MASKKVLYSDISSPPCRAVLLTAKACGVDLTIKSTDVMKGEQLKPEFVAINPQHIVPTLVDGNLSIWESRAICTYLVAKYAKDDSLYPKDPDTRVVIDQRLYFDIGTLYQRFANYAYPLLEEEEDKLYPDRLKKFFGGMKLFEGIMTGSKYVAGNSLTVADINMAASVSSFKACDLDFSPYPNVLAWLKRCEDEIPGYKEINEPGAKIFGELLNSIIFKK